MDELLLRSHELRDDPAVHYNCAQGVFIPFAEPKDAVAFIQKISSLHGGRTQCRDLLAAEVTSKEQKKPHCDGMVYEAVEAVEEMLRERGIEI